MFRHNVGIKTIVDKSLRDWMVVQEILLLSIDMMRVFGDKVEDKKWKDRIQACVVKLSEVNITADKYIEYYNSVSVQYDEESTREIDLIQENERLKCEITGLNKEIQEKNDRIKELEDRETSDYIYIQGTLENTVTNLGDEVARKNDVIDILRNEMHIKNEMNNRCDELLNMVEENIKTLAVSVDIKRGKEAKIPHRLIRDLDTEEIIKDYVDSGYRLNRDIVSKYKDKYGITYSGLRARLVNVGVWKDRGSKEQE